MILISYRYGPSSCDKTLFLWQDCCKLELAFMMALSIYASILFQEVLGRTINGTTYVGIRARTTGAPQNHWYVIEPQLLLSESCYAWIIDSLLKSCYRGSYKFCRLWVYDIACSFIWSQVWTSWWSEGCRHWHSGGHKTCLVLSSRSDSRRGPDIAILVITSAVINPNVPWKFVPKPLKKKKHPTGIINHLVQMYFATYLCW
jgi:hypothetical protein